MSGKLEPVGESKVKKGFDVGHVTSAGWDTLHEQLFVWTNCKSTHARLVVEIRGLEWVTAHELNGSVRTFD